MTETNECLICSCDCSLNDLIEYPNKNVSCKCKFHIHKKCSEKLKNEWGNKCPMCFKEYEVIEIDITNENNNNTENNTENNNTENNIIISYEIEENSNNNKCGSIIASVLFFSIQFMVIGLLVHFA